MGDFVSKYLKTSRKMIKKVIHRGCVYDFPVMPYETMRLTSWHPRKSVNFGDELARIIVSLMLARRGATPFDSVATGGQLLAVGSVLQHARSGAVVWGSGVRGPEKLITLPSRLDVRAVRGPISARILRSFGANVPNIYGDPALLLPYLCGERFVRTNEYDIGFVPHFDDAKMTDVKYLSESAGSVLIINPLRSWNSVIGDILKCKFVIASSLHALVVSDAYGIPNVYVRLTEKEDLLKYHDYYEGSGRELRFVRGFKQALDAGGECLRGYDRGPLIDAFPYDLWAIR